MNLKIIRISVLLFSIFIAYLAYATFYSHAIISDKQTGKIIFGYDHTVGKFYINEYPLTLKCSDGPYVLYKDNSAIITRALSKNENDFRVESNTLTLSDLYEKGLNVLADSASSFYVSIQREIKSTESTYPMPEKLLAFSDIEGNFYALKQLLLHHKVMDEQFNWTFGRGHLVLVGNFMDRGEEVLSCLWLVYRLEQLAKIHQGRVHFILGNHEQMNLVGDHRYTATKYKRLSDALKLSYQDFFGDQTELGRWLRSKNVIEKIGTTLFVHGGISKEVAALNLDLDQINTLARDHLTRNESELPDDTAQLLDHQTGLLWYRGWVQPYKKEGKLAQEEANAILRKMNADRLVVAHTLVPSVSADYNNKLIRLDVKQPTEKNMGMTQALLVEKEKWYAVNDNNTKTLLFTER